MRVCAGACALAAALWLSAAAVPAAVPCGGDCNADGRVAVDELIAAVGAALGGAADTCGADLDDDARLAIGELIRLVGLALGGCPLPLDTAVLDGVYDADARGQTDPSGGFNKRGVAVVEVSGDVLDMVIHFGPLERIAVRGRVAADGALALLGDGQQSGEHDLMVSGLLDIVQEGRSVIMRGTMDFELTVLPGAYRLDVLFERPLAGSPPLHSGTQRFSLRHPMQGGAAPLSRLDLPLSVPRSGRAQCAASADILSDGSVRAELPATECLVSASSRFLYAAPYLVAGTAQPLPLHLTGTLSGEDGIGRGTFYVAEFPTIAESGVWQVERIDSEDDE